MIFDRWNHLVRKSKAIKQGAMQVKSNPSKWIAFVDSVNSPYARAAVNLVSRVTEPRVAANGMRILEFDEETLLTKISSNFYNRSDTGKISSAAAIELAEFTLSRFWSRFLIAGATEIQYKRFEVEWLNWERGDLRAEYALSTQDREDIMRRLYSDSQVAVDFDIPLSNSDQKMCAHIRGQCLLSTALMLPSSSDLSSM